MPSASAVSPPAQTEAGAPGLETASDKAFAVRLDNFEGPFDLLVSLITKHQLNITEIALAEVTDEFIAYAEACQEVWPLSQASEFLVVAAVLLDLKAASLLPGGLADSEDLELLEARDLLFARLLEYRAFKEIAAGIGARLLEQARHRPRITALEPQFSRLLPDLLWSIGPAQLAAVAAAALSRPPAAPTVPLDHLHPAPVSVGAQARVIAERLAAAGATTFRTLMADAEGSLSVIVARFLALLEMFRAGQVAFEQPEALGDLAIIWTGASVEVEISEEFA
ncbi:MAG: segregation/condensation protein A [Bifidobacteriaceae bacterium]|jgi:segregation and condensation protein A|nr:segregation/condensation protein A [Bifidobacteriaceae bacterium]